jgi:dTDP-4-amino-4,6-dideoxygalactose transaminase
MPSFTFVSTANAFALRGATPVFVDVDPATFTIDTTRVAAAITSRTRAIVAVHYAGVACDMDALGALADASGLVLIEDAAQGISASYRGRPLGAIGALGALSFHETKNVIAGEGGALLVRDAAYIARAEILREKGTNRGAFFRGAVDKYTWVDLGSSYLPSEINAAFLWAQLEVQDSLTDARLRVWERYDRALAGLEERALLRRPVVPGDRTHNAHMYHVILPTHGAQQGLIRGLGAAGIGAVFHYVPLHSAPAGLRLGRTAGPLDVTDAVSARLVRLPMWPGMAAHVDEVIEHVLRLVPRIAVPALLDDPLQAHARPGDRGA